MPSLVARPRRRFRDVTARHRERAIPGGARRILSASRVRCSSSPSTAHGGAAGNGLGARCFRSTRRQSTRWRPSFAPLQAASTRAPSSSARRGRWRCTSRGRRAREDGPARAGGGHRRSVARCPPGLRGAARGARSSRSVRAWRARPTPSHGSGDCSGPTCRLLVVGDDVTDEDMFAAASDDDAPVLVGAEPGRLTAARWRLESSDEVRAFYDWIISLRREASGAVHARRPSRVETLPGTNAAAASFDLLVLSNRLPELAELAAALSDPQAQRRRPRLGARARVLTRAQGHLARMERAHATPTPTATEVGLDDRGRPRARVGRLPRGVASPLLQRSVQQRALAPSPLVPGARSSSRTRTGTPTSARTRPSPRWPRSSCEPRATIWVHDYHLLLVARSSSARAGIRGRIGLFQHIPFPGPDIFFLLPWAQEILAAMLDARPRRLSHARVRRQLPAVHGDAARRAHRGRRRRPGRSTPPRGQPFPLGIIPEEFQERRTAPVERARSRAHARDSDRRAWCSGSTASTTRRASRSASRRSAVCSSDSREWRRKACLVQVSVPSRADMPGVRRAAQPHREHRRPHQRRIRRGRLGAHPVPLPLVRARASSRSSIAPPTSAT